jgi:hypothetical protein
MEWNEDRVECRTGGISGAEPPGPAIIVLIAVPRSKPEGTAQEP